MKTPVFCSPAIPATSGTQYSTCHDTSYDTARKGWVGTEPYGSIVQCDGTVFTLRVKVNTAPGSGKSWTVTLRVDGVDTALYVTLADTATEASATGTIAITANQRLTLKCVPSGTPAAPGRFATSLGFESTVSGESFFSAYTDIDFNGGGSAPLNGTGAAGYQIIPCAGVLSNFRGRTNVALGSGESFVMYVNVNGTDSTLTFTCDQTNQVKEDTTHTVRVAAGDRVYINGVHYSGSAMIGISMGCKFTPDVPGQSAILGYFIVDSGSAGEYLPVGNGTWKDHEGEAGAKNLVPFDVTWQAVYMQTSSAPGAGGTYSLTARLGGASQSLVATVSGASQTDTNDLAHATALVAGNDVDFVTGTTGGGFVANIRHGSIFYLAETVLRINGSANAGAIKTSNANYSFDIVVPDAHSSVTVMVVDNGSGDPSVTLAGSAMTKVTNACKSISGLRVTTWKTIDKAAGTHSVSVTPDSSVTKSWAAAYSWGGDNTDAPVEDTSGGNTGTAVTSISTTLSPASGSIGLDMLCMSGEIAFSANSPQVRLDTSGVNFLRGATSKQVSSVNTTMGWTHDSHNVVQAVIWMKLPSAATYLSPVVFFSRRLKHPNLRR